MVVFWVCVGLALGFVWDWFGLDLVHTWLLSGLRKRNNLLSTRLSGAPKTNAHEVSCRDMAGFLRGYMNSKELWYTKGAF